MVIKKTIVYLCSQTLNMKLVYVVLDSESHIFGVRLTLESAETLRKQSQETLEYSGSRLKARIDIQELKD